MLSRGLPRQEDEPLRALLGRGQREAAMLTGWEREFVLAQRVARLATVDAAGQPHVVPIVFASDGSLVFTPLDHKPKRVAAGVLRRVQNIVAHPEVALVVDRYAEDWAALVWVQIRGRAAVLSAGADYDHGVALLTARYPQYRARPLQGRPLICITPLVVRSWRGAET